MDAPTHPTNSRVQSAMSLQREYPCRYHPYMQALWDRIEERGITEKELGDLSGVAAPTIRHWRVHGRTPSFTNFMAVANVVGLDLKLEEV